MGARTWKSFDWDAMNRLHEKGLISNPVSKAKSVALTEAGLRQAEAAFHRLFETPGSTTDPSRASNATAGPRSTARSLAS